MLILALRDIDGHVLSDVDFRMMWHGLDLTRNYGQRIMNLVSDFICICSLVILICMNLFVGLTCSLQALRTVIVVKQYATSRHNLSSKDGQLNWLITMVMSKLILQVTDRCYVLEPGCQSRRPPHLEVVL